MKYIGKSKCCTNEKQNLHIISGNSQQDTLTGKDVKQLYSQSPSFNCAGGSCENSNSTLFSVATVVFTLPRKEGQYVTHFDIIVPYVFGGGWISISRKVIKLGMLSESKKNF